MISVIVPTYNEEGNIEKCLKSLSEQTIPRESFEVIVVDGQSKDRTTEIAKKYAEKVIQQVSKGVGGARNDGVRIAEGKIIATTDADCEANNQWLETILEEFKEEKLVALTGTLDPFDLKDLKTYEKYIYKLLFQISNLILLLMSKVGFYHLCGANSAFKKNVFLEIGGYLDLPYSDDVEIFKRLKTKGKIIFNKNLQVKYSVRRIKKIGLFKYLFMIIKNDFKTMVLGLKSEDDIYARQDYD